MAKVYIKNIYNIFEACIKPRKSSIELIFNLKLEWKNS